MSLLVMTWVFYRSKTKGTDKLVLLTLADEADDTGGSCYPSMRTIATKSSLSVGGVRKAIERLEADGALLVVRPPRQGRGHHNRYQVVLTSDQERSDDPDTPPGIKARLVDPSVAVKARSRDIKARSMERANPVPKGTDPGRSPQSVPVFGSAEAAYCDDCGARGGRHADHCALDAEAS